MAIPFLPSLVSRAFANDPDPGAVPKRFLAMSTMLGEIWGQNMYPDESILTQTVDYAGRQVRFGSLPATLNESGTVAFSPMCSANSQLMTPVLASKFNILRGLDIPYNMGHHEGVHLGNFAGHFTQAAGGIPSKVYLNPTIDQVMAFAPNFYSPEDLSAKMTQRSFRLGPNYMSWNYTSPSTKTGRVKKLPTTISRQRADGYGYPADRVGTIWKRPDHFRTRCLRTHRRIRLPFR